MKISPAKENILKKIRQALSHSTPVPFPASEGNNSLYPAPAKELELEFAEKFSALMGKFIFCINQEELQSQLTRLVQHMNWKSLYCREEKLVNILEKSQAGYLNQSDLAGCDAAITSCELLIARTGSIILSAAQQSGRTVSVYAPIHICIAYTDQLVYDIKDGLHSLKDKYQQKMPSLISFATGPSRTADIEKTLVVGVHGPKEVYVFLLDRA